MKIKRLIPIIAIFTLTMVFGTSYSAWVATSPAVKNNVVHVEVPNWRFEDTDFAKADNLLSCTNLNVTKEETITQNSGEAIKIESTTGSTTKDHIINIQFDRDYYLSEIKYYKFEFDYYHRYKREQHNKGFPKVQFLINTSTLGSDQGGTDTCTSTSPFVATNIDEDWWHLEYFVFAHMPTLARHSDTPIALTKKVNGVRINDRTMYDYAGTTAYAIIDNMKFSSEPTSRLGIFNRWTSAAAGQPFWFKVAFAGELHSVKLYSSDSTIATPEFDPTDTVSTTAPFPDGSPFYYNLLSPGTVVLTAVLEVGDSHTIMTISNTFTVT